VQVDLGTDSRALEYLSRSKRARGRDAAWLSFDYGGTVTVLDKASQDGRYYTDAITGKAVKIDL